MNQRDLTLLTDFYELTMMQGYYEKRDRTRPLFLMYLSSESLQWRLRNLRRTGTGH